eukprot:1268263-Pleurochrysis_carterae.AAC.4
MKNKSSFRLRSSDHIQHSAMPRLLPLLLLACAASAAAFLAPATAAPSLNTMACRSAGSSDMRSSVLSMTSINKKAKAAKNKAKSSSAVTKRFKATATGKLLRHKAFRAHILTKKHPQRKQRLRRTSAVDETQLDTMRKLMLVVPKKK